MYLLKSLVRCVNLPPQTCVHACKLKHSRRLNSEKLSRSSRRVTLLKWFHFPHDANRDFFFTKCCFISRWTTWRSCWPEKFSLNFIQFFICRYLLSAVFFLFLLMMMIMMSSLSSPPPTYCNAQSLGYAVAQLIEALYYKPESRGFDPWCVLWDALFT
jgi:hypothetical protein